MESCSSKFFQERGELGVFFSHFSTLYLHVFPYTCITTTPQLPIPTSTIPFSVTTWYNSFCSFFYITFCLQYAPSSTSRCVKRENLLEILISDY